MARFARWLEVKRIFEGALEVPPEERAAFLDRACLGDEELRREVEALLATPAVPTSSLAGRLGLPGRREEPDYAEGDTIDHFTIVRRVGDGGMGVVYEARDTRNNNRPVALKVLFSRAVNFSQDKRLAGFSTPTIVTFHDSGETPEGLPYFVFEYIDGEPITAYCERLGLPERLRLFQKVCDAVRYAHQRLVIHCDLKPENILVTATGELKLLDFGIAKEVGTIDAAPGRPSPMTLPFASPEQVGNEETTTLSDVYSLGVLLCVLLTGRLPYRHTTATAAELLDAILHEEPLRVSELAWNPASSMDGEVPRYSSLPPELPPRKLAKRLRGDLDAIVLKALRKKPEGRYFSVKELSDDIGHYLRHEPVIARDGAWYYRAYKFLERRRVGVVLSTIVVLGVISFSMAQGYQYRETVRQRDQAQQQAARAERVSQFLTDLFRLPDPRLRAGSIVTARELLDKAAKEIPRALDDQPLTQVYLLNTEGEVYRNLGLFDEAGKCHGQALRIARERLGSNSLGTADSLFFLGVLRGAQGKFAESEEFHREALGVRQRHLPTSHPDIANSIYNLGVAAAGQHHYEQATRLYNRALALQRANPKPDRQAIGKYLNALGDNYISLKQLAKAEQVLREALRIQEAIYGEVHPEVAVTLNNLAVVLENNQKFDEAEALQKRALSISRKLLGDNHPDVVIALSNLAFLQYTKGDESQAVKTFREALKASRVALGNDHPDTLNIMVNLARSVSDCGHPSDGDHILAEAYNIAMHAPVKDYSVIGNILKTQAQSLVYRRRFREAEARAREAVAALSKSEGPNSYPVAMTMAEVASSIAEQKRFQEAEPLLLEYLQVSIERDKADAFWRLARLYELWGNQGLSAKYEKLLAEQRAIH